MIKIVLTQDLDERKVEIFREYHVGAVGVEIRTVIAKGDRSSSHAELFDCLYEKLLSVFGKVAGP